MLVTAHTDADFRNTWSPLVQGSLEKSKGSNLLTLFSLGLSQQQIDGYNAKIEEEAKLAPESGEIGKDE